jgi:hypothetical protein
MRLEIAIQGNLHAFMSEQKKAMEKAVSSAVKEITNGMKKDLRSQVSGAGLGKVVNTWQSVIKTPHGDASKTVGWVFSKAPNIIKAFDEGSLIKGKESLFLAIPTPSAPKKGYDGKRISPSNFPEQRLGGLRFVYRQGKPSLLVVENLVSGGTGRFRRGSQRALRTGRGLTTVIMFILVPQVKMQKRLDYKRIFTLWERKLPETILRYWPEERSR